MNWDEGTECAWRRKCGLSPRRPGGRSPDLISQKDEFEAFDTRPFTLRVLRHDHSTPIGERRLKRHTSNVWYGMGRAAGFVSSAVDPRDDEAPHARKTISVDQTLRCRSRTGLARAGELHCDAARWEDSPA